MFDHFTIGNAINQINNAANTVVTALCSAEVKYFIDKAREFNVIPLSVAEARDTICGIWNATKGFFKSIEPYQPIAATATIISKAVWKTRTNKRQVSETINDKRKTLAILKHAHTKKIGNFSEKIFELRKDIQSRKDDRSVHTNLALLQLGSLLFAHPGSNVWNSVNTLCGRLFSLRSYMPLLNPSFRNSISKSKMAAALGAISVAGTAISLLKQTGAIQGDTAICHGIIGSSFIGMAIETGLMIKNLIRSIY